MNDSNSRLLLLKKDMRAGVCEKDSETDKSFGSHTTWETIEIIVIDELGILNFFTFSAYFKFKFRGCAAKRMVLNYNMNVKFGKNTEKTAEFLEVGIE